MDNPESAAPAGAVSRRAVLQTATAAAGIALGGAAALAQTGPAPGFGAPLAEIHVPAGVLTLEQKSAMIRGVTDVLVRAIGLPADQARKLFVQIIETTEGGFGVGGQVFVPRARR